MTVEAPQNSQTKAIIAALFSFLSLALIGVSAKIAIKSASSSIIWVMFLQCATAFTVAIIMTLREGFASVKTQKLPLHFLRAMCGLFSFGAFMIAMTEIPLVDASLLQNTSPLFIPLISFFWLKTAINKPVWLGVIVGFVGIMLIIKPDTGMLFKKGDLIGLASGIILAVGYIVMKLLTKTESFTAILFYFTLITFIITAPIALMSKPYPDLHTVLLSAACGIFLVLFLFTLRYAYSLAEPVRIAPLNYSVVVFTGICDWILFGNIPDLMTIAGIVLVSAGGIAAISLHERGKEPVRHTWH